MRTKLGTKCIVQIDLNPPQHKCEMCRIKVTKICVLTVLCKGRNALKQHLLHINLILIFLNNCTRCKVIFMGYSVSISSQSMHKHVLCILITQSYLNLLPKLTFFNLKLNKINSLLEQ